MVGGTRRSDASAFLRTLALLYRPASLSALLLALVQLVSGVVPAALIGLTGLVASGAVTALWALVPLVVVLLVFSDSLETFAIVLVTAVRDRASLAARAAFVRRVADWPDMAVFEDGELAREREISAHAIERVPRVTLILSNGFAGLVGIVPLLVLGWGITPLLPILIVVGLVPVSLYSLRVEERVWDAERSFSEDRAEADAHRDVAVLPAFAKDLRTSGMQAWAPARWFALESSLLRSLLALRRRGAVWIVVLTLISTGTSILALVIAVGGDRFAPGAAVVALGLLVQLRTTMFVVVGNLQQAAQVWHPLVDLARFLAREAPSGGPPAVVPADPSTVLRLEDVSFAYQGARRAVDSVTLEIARGERVALVGANGSGKSTLTKLIAGLYAPDAGRLERRGGLAMLHQDFARFPLTLAENVQTGDEDDGGLDRVLALVGLADLVDALPDGTATSLARAGRGQGVELSGGQWQRVALARAVHRGLTSDLVVLDEATSALDPESEQSVMSAVDDALAGRARLWVTHRMSQAAICDRVAVLEHGRLAALGTPAEVYEASAWFRTSYDAQATGYRTLG